MTKQEFIFELTKKLNPDADQFYINAIIDVIRLAHKLDETQIVMNARVPTVEQVKCEGVAKLYKILKSNVTEGVAFQIVDHILGGRKLAAIKTYKEFANLGLKDAKDEIEELAKAMHALINMPKSQYFGAEEIMALIRTLIRDHFRVKLTDACLEPIAVLLFQGKVVDAEDYYYANCKYHITYDNGRQDIDAVLKELRNRGF
jgi:ribosomal protein L7/L12